MTRTFIAIVVVTCFLPMNVWASHEPDHRYTIKGYVLDANEKPLADVGVAVRSEGGVLGSGKTDLGGYYSISLHLHNTDLGRRLRLEAGEAEGEISVTFDPRDRRAVRVHHASFIGERLEEGRLGRFRIPAWAYVLATFVGLGVLLVLLERRRKRRARLLALAAVPAQPRRKRRRKGGGRKRP